MNAPCFKENFVQSFIKYLFVFPLHENHTYIYDLASLRHQNILKKYNQKLDQKIKKVVKIEKDNKWPDRLTPGFHFSVAKRGYSDHENDHKSMINGEKLSGTRGGRVSTWVPFNDPPLPTTNAMQCFIVVLVQAKKYSNNLVLFGLFKANLDQFYPFWYIQVYKSIQVLFGPIWSKKKSKDVKWS